MQIDPPVLPALLLDLAEPKPADLAGARHMGAAAGLKIDLSLALPDPDEAHAPGPARRRDRHSLDQPGTGRELRIGDPVLRYRQVALDQKLATAAVPKDGGAESAPAPAEAPASSGRKAKKGKGIPLFSTSSHRKY